MKRYGANSKAPMKFHNLYVMFLNPLGILLLAGAAVLVLLTAIHQAPLSAAINPFDGNGLGKGDMVLWLMFGFLALAFLFALVAEILLAKRRTIGVAILIAGYLLNVVSSFATAYNEQTAENLIALGITVLLSILVCIYYWKRGRLFH
jgi:hypothetical protein